MPFCGKTSRARRMRHYRDDISTHSTHTHSHYILTNTHTEQRKLLNIIHSNTYVSIKCRLTPRTTPLNLAYTIKTKTIFDPCTSQTKRKCYAERASHVNKHNAQKISPKVNSPTIGIDPSPTMEAAN